MMEYDDSLDTDDELYDLDDEDLNLTGIRTIDGGYHGLFE